MIQFDEFVQMMLKYGATSVEEQLRDAFSIIDRDNSGKISSDELKKLMRSLGEALSDQELEDLVREVDMDGDGEVDFEG